MNNLVESFIPGRVRLRSSLLKSPAAPLILAAFEDLPGVRSVELNRLTGSLLLKYDAAVLTAERLMPALPLFEQIKALEREAPAPACPELRPRTFRALCGLACRFRGCAPSRFGG